MTVQGLGFMSVFPQKSLLKSAFWAYTWAQNVFPGWLAYEKNAYLSEGRESGRKGCHSYQIFEI